MCKKTQASLWLGEGKQFPWRTSLSEQRHSPARVARGSHSLWTACLTILTIYFAPFLQILSLHLHNLSFISSFSILHFTAILVYHTLFTKITNIQALCNSFILSWYSPLLLSSLHRMVPPSKHPQPRPGLFHHNNRVSRPAKQQMSIATLNMSVLLINSPIFHSNNILPKSKQN